MAVYRPATQQLLDAVGWLRRGIKRFTVRRCPVCSTQNRIDRWRMMWTASRAKCGNCGIVLAYVSNTPDRTDA